MRKLGRGCYLHRGRVLLRTALRVWEVGVLDGDPNGGVTIDGNRDYPTLRDARAAIDQGAEYVKPS